jgi:hypothetical protein
VGSHAELIAQAPTRQEEERERERPVARRGLLWLLGVAAALPLAAVALGAGSRATAHSEAPPALPAWLPQQSGTQQDLYFVKSSGSYGVVAGNGILLTTEDGGQRWRARAAPPLLTARLYLSAPREGRRVISAYDARGRLSSSVDGGDSWGAPLEPEERLEGMGRPMGEQGGEGKEIFYFRARGFELSYHYRLNGMSPTRSWVLPFLPLDVWWVQGRDGLPADIYIVGEGGGLARIPGQQGQVQLLESGTSVDLRGVWTDGGGRAYAVGDEGTILSRADFGEPWIQEESGTKESLFDVGPLTEQGVYAVGAKGTILKRRAASPPLARAEAVTIKEANALPVNAPLSAPAPAPEEPAGPASAPLKVLYAAPSWRVPPGMTGTAAIPYLLDEATKAAVRKDFSSALEMLDEVARIDPGNTELHRIRATVYSRQGNPEKACSSFKKFLQKAPAAHPQAGMARSFMESQNKDEYPSCDTSKL